MSTGFVIYILLLLVLFVIIGYGIHIIYKIKEARLLGKNISKKNWLYTITTKYFIKKFKE
ncbi:hypothetical protein SCB49_06847 [unidentified eubacterium SCB49]|nr:hypothetical protein SCB49_06847 [unidentified eubacterium SCB49]